MFSPATKGEFNYASKPRNLEDSYPATEAGVLDNDSIFSNSVEFDTAEKLGSSFAIAAPKNGSQELLDDVFGPESSEPPIMGRCLGGEEPLLREQHASSAVKPRKIPLPSPKHWEPLGMAIPINDTEDEFDIGTALKPVFHEDAAEEPKAVFVNSEPDMKGEVVSCFDEPGLLYRVIDRKNKIWAFYNDSLSFSVHVCCTFGKHSKLEALENTVFQYEEDGSITAEVIVYPCETELFVRGFVNGFSSRLRAFPLSDEYFLERQALQHKSVVEGEIMKVRALVGDETDSTRVLEACREHSVPFVDLEFQPVQSSIDRGAEKPLRKLPWFRPRMYLRPGLDKQVRLFRKPIVPGDVQQGELGDCWMMCAIATLAEHPEELMRMFYHPHGAVAARAERDIGAYRVTLNKNGLWSSIIVDDYFPTVAGALRFARSSDPCELWPAVLEKAYAKVHNGYGMVQSGDPVHALTDMTGCPSSRFDESFAEAQFNGGHELFQQLLEHDRDGYQIILTTPGKAPAFISGTNKYAGIFTDNPELEELLGGTGLVPGNAYTVRAVRHFTGKENVRLLKIRNIWGFPEAWSGPWSTKSPEWHTHTAVAKACKNDVDNINDSDTIWMEWQSVLKYFNGGGVHFLRPAYDYRIPLIFSDCRPSLVLEVRVDTPIWMTFILSNVNCRSVCNDNDTNVEGDVNKKGENMCEYPPLMISLSSPYDSKGREHKVIQNTSLDVSKPSPEKWTFMQAREISMIYKLTPEQSPYLIIPRMMEMEATVTHSTAWFAHLQDKIHPLHFVNRCVGEEVGGGGELEVPVVLGIRCAGAIGDEGNGGVQVNFRCLNRDNVVFENFPRFPAETTMANDVYYQVRSPTQGTLEEKAGASLF